MASEPEPDEQPTTTTTTTAAAAHGVVELAQEIDFVTLGMFIIDDIEYRPPRPAERDVLGGAGSYAALGARLFSPAPTESQTVGWVVDKGSDFPPSVSTLIDSWTTSALVRHDLDRLTTRGWNGYVDDKETRAFKYTTPKKRLVASDLSGTPLLQAKAFHIICSPSRCRELVTELLTLRKEQAPPEEPESPEGEAEGGGGGGYTRPTIIWEPVPDLCTPEELLNLTNCLPLVDVCSPNHSELASFMGDTAVDPDTGEISTAAVERACEQLLGSMPLSSFTLVIRAGEKGCYLAKNGGRRKTPAKEGKGGAGNGRRRRRKEIGHHGGLQPDTDMMSLFAGLLQQSPSGPGDGEGEGEGGGGETYSFIHEEDNEVEIDPGLDRWIPAYWTKELAEKVVDPTGGGNTFLGGLAVALARGKSLEEAACWGTVAASFAIEQVGVPSLGKTEEGEETWNDVQVEARLRELHERIGWTED
ncbi:hypothetical protein M406DRAFT_39374 [Cryphonectria parasitica EP155]|uniref:Carbohydrate kinase PfkB domain-containing protein n=1 Tax=Cryphonectria parasitica (strain ATCC 38755 / EP155) TaxID=660469 RepID=A0A9P4Y615_CRYP1|nr:uncharacterized protein M406DRAFT_39374 [Cryphonectria parasitica EP155]KAF3767368.1 hypothetical protein M406DRAFT_39374 [Cryphonectria parasitica EP155]